MNTYYLEPDKDYHTKVLNNDDPSSVNQQLLADTMQYYEDCHNDYLVAWCNRQNLALHYGYWDSSDPYDHHQALLNTNQILYDKAAIKQSEHVLDAGCGLGGSSIWMAEQHGNKVTGITISNKQADYAAKSAKKRQLEHLADFQVTDYCHTPFEDESFDIVWALESSCYALNKADLVKEAFRLLKPGGRLALCDAFMLQRDFNKGQWNTVMDFFNGWAVPNLASRTEFSNMLDQAGFQNIQITDISEQVLPSSKHMYRVGKRLLPVQKISQWLKLRSKIQTANFKVSFAQYDFFHNRLAEYCIFVAEKK